MASVTVHYPVLILFIITLAGAAYLGFGSFQTSHDKLLHFTTFMILAVEMWFVVDVRHPKGGKPIRFAMIFVLATASVFSELVQSLVNPARVFDPMDIVFNVLGSTVGVIICTTINFYTFDRARYIRGLGPPPAGLEQGSEQEITEEGYVNIQMKDVVDA